MASRTKRHSAQLDHDTSFRAVASGAAAAGVAYIFRRLHSRAAPFIMAAVWGGTQSRSTRSSATDRETGAAA